MDESQNMFSEREKIYTKEHIYVVTLIWCCKTGIIILQWKIEHWLSLEKKGRIDCKMVWVENYLILLTNVTPTLKKRVWGYYHNNISC